MPDIEPIEKASQDFAADLADLRDGLAKLSASVSDLAPEPAQAAATMVYPFLSVVAAFSAGLLIGMIGHTRK
jgi:hypothetical protein